MGKWIIWIAAGLVVLLTVFGAAAVWEARSDGSGGTPYNVVK